MIHKPKENRELLLDTLSWAFESLFSKLRGQFGVKIVSKDIRDVVLVSELEYVLRPVIKESFLRSGHLFPL